MERAKATGIWRGRNKLRLGTDWRKGQKESELTNRDGEKEANTQSTWALRIGGDGGKKRA